MITGIAFIGAQESGKTTLAKACNAAFVAGRKLSFADALREEVAAALGWADSDDEHDYNWYLTEMTTVPNKYKYGPLLQWWGTDFRRAQNPNYWVDRLVERMEAYTNYSIYLIDDCRFNNEYEMLKARGFTFIELEANPNPSPLDKRDVNHSSEADWVFFKTDERLAWMPVQQRLLDVIRICMESDNGEPPRLNIYATGVTPDA